MRNFVSLFFIFLVGADEIITEEEPFYEFETTFDQSGIPNGYSAYIKSPVCEKDKCYEIEINFQWDLIGRFEEYDTLSGKGLTKLDHIPFTEQDYQKLKQLLKDPNSPIGTYAKEELILDTRKSEIDGFTGATIREINDIVVAGGVYSCYTLWHLAHRKFNDSITKMTMSLLDQNVMKKFLTEKDQATYYFIINNLQPQDFLNYRNEVLEMITPNQGYFVKNTIEKMPMEMFQDSITQEFFAKKISSLNYFTQVAFLKKLNNIPLTKALKNTLTQQIDERNSLKNKLIQDLIQ